jgi:hypothetical protein
MKGNITVNIWKLGIQLKTGQLKVKPCSLPRIRLEAENCLLFIDKKIYFYILIPINLNVRKVSFI